MQVLDMNQLNRMVSRMSEYERSLHCVLLQRNKYAVIKVHSCMYMHACKTGIAIAIVRICSILFSILMHKIMV